MQNKDNDTSGDTKDTALRARQYAMGLSTQFKKGLLSYCTLLACQQSTYTSEIIKKLNLADLDVVEGTIYPLLARLQRDGLLQHTWKESPQGPPRKYYSTTDYGQIVCSELAKTVKVFNQAIKTLERSKHE